MNLDGLVKGGCGIVVLDQGMKRGDVPLSNALTNAVLQRTDVCVCVCFSLGVMLKVKIMAYRDGIFLGVNDLHVDLHILISSLGPPIEETVQQGEVDIVTYIICREQSVRV